MIPSGGASSFRNEYDGHTIEKKFGTGSEVDWKKDQTISRGKGISG